MVLGAGEVGVGAEWWGLDYGLGNGDLWMGLARVSSRMVRWRMCMIRTRWGMMDGSEDSIVCGSKLGWEVVSVDESCTLIGLVVRSALCQCFGCISRFLPHPHSWIVFIRSIVIEGRLLGAASTAVL